MKTTLRSMDLTCPSCIAKIEAGLRQLPGVTDVKVHFNSGRIVVEHDDSQTGVEVLRGTVRALGYETMEPTA